MWVYQYEKIRPLGKAMYLKLIALALSFLTNTKAKPLTLAICQIKVLPIFLV